MGKKRESTARTKRGGRRRRKELIDPALAVLVRDPIRIRIMAAASEGPIGPAEFCRREGLELGATAYQFRELQKAGFLELLKEYTVRGATAHLYRATRSGLIDEEEWASLDDDLKPGVAGEVAETLFIRIMQSVATGAFLNRDDAVLLWAPVKLDARTWPKFVRLMERTYEEVKDLEVETVESRAEGAGEEQVSCTFSICGFESPCFRDDD